MNRVGYEAPSYSKDVSFNFSGSLRGEKVNLEDFSSYTYILDVDGTLYQGAQANDKQASICIIGGTTKFVNSKKPDGVHSNFYITEAQKVSLYKIVKKMSEYSDSANITSDNDKLEQAINSLYSNYCG
jgi:hypothetical protein